MSLSLENSHMHSSNKDNGHRQPACTKIKRDQLAASNISRNAVCYELDLTYLPPLAIILDKSLRHIDRQRKNLHIPRDVQPANSLSAKRYDVVDVMQNAGRFA